jgi:MoxR-like ATPase
MQEATTTTDTREKLARVERELGAEVLEREEVVRSMILALIAGEHVLLLGPPGTAKSRLARSLCERISGASYFYACLNRSSLPDEVFGPLMLSALREDRFERNTQGMLPEAEVAFVDEVFKSNSAVLNGMLPILNERVYKSGASAAPVPLQMAVCASNEMPEDREELSALYDRLLVRHLVLPIRDERSFEAVLLGRTRYAPPPAAPRTTITLSEIVRAREEASEVDLSGVVSQVSEIRRDLLEKGIEPSVRRFDRSCYLVRASAYLGGRGEANEEDLAPLRHVLWEETEQIGTVADAILCRANPYLKDAQDLADEAEEVRSEALKADELEAASMGAEANRKLKGIEGRLLDLRLKAKGAGRSTDAIDAALSRAKDMRKEVVGRCLGVEDI